MNNYDSLEKRISRLEEKVDDLRDLIDEFKTAAEKDRNEIKKLIEKINNEIAHYKGFVGGIFLILTGIGGIIMFMKDHFFRFLGK